MGKFINLIGQRFGKLLVLERIADYISPKGEHLVKWLCKCDCGNISNVTSSSLKRGTKSCGCLNKISRKKICGIYCIENKINHKKYIGRSENIFSRWAVHKRLLRKGIHESGHLQNSFIKYGENNFYYWIIEECSEDIKIMIERENYWMNFYNTKNEKFGFNIIDGNSGFKNPRKETRQKMSNSAKGNTSHKGFKHSEEVRKTMGREKTQEQLKKASIAMQGKRKSFSTGKYVGAHWDKSRNKWMAQITYMGKSITIGMYDTEKEAAIAYNKKAIELFGPNARINIIED